MSKKSSTVLLLLMALLICSTRATAHPLAPALLEISEKTDGNHIVLWRISAIQGSRSIPQPSFPEHCRYLSSPVISLGTGAAVSSEWQMGCGNQGLRGETISVSRLTESGINVILKLSFANGDKFQGLLDSRSPEYLVPSQSDGNSAFRRYLSLGAEHLLAGPDHLLFLLALIIISGLSRQLVWTLTAFTLGHSLTLSLASLKLVSVNPMLMETGIAISLIVAARELLRSTPSVLGRHPASMAAAFGLIHGMGFAGALQEIGLPGNHLFISLLGFNLGIEVAQLALVLILYVTIKIIRHYSKELAPLKPTPALPAYVIGSLASMWFIERSFAVLV